MEDEATLELAFKEADAAYSTIIAEAESDAASVDELMQAMQAIREKLQAAQAERKEIEERQFHRRAEIRKAELARQKAESAFIEAKRVREHEEAQGDAFKAMVADARAAQYAWVDKAHPHQWEGGMTIAHYGSCILGDGTGTGKTLTAIMSMDFAKAKKVLVLCPTDVVSSFAEDMTFFAPHRNALPLEGANPKYRKTVKTILANSAEYTVIANYESLWREAAWLGDFEWDYIYIDEAHNMKNEAGLTFDALSRFTYKECVPMTATSILNEPADIWTSLNMIDPGRFTSKYAFLSVFCEQDSEGKWKFKEGGEATLMRQLKGRVLKRTLEEVAPNLPKQTVNEVLVPMAAVSHRQATIMTQLKNFAGIMLDDGQKTSIQAIIALITRERQAATFPAGIEVKVTEKMYEEWIGEGPCPPVGTVIFSVPKDTPSIKLDMAEDKLFRMAKLGKRSVVFSQFKTALVDLQDRLEKRGLRVARFDGDTNKATRLRIKRDFLRSSTGERKTEFEYDVVLANYKTGGVGLTFTEATYMLCLDEEWNPAKNTQAWARIHRIGQTEETVVDILRLEASIDIWMKKLNIRKGRIAKGFEDQIDMVADLKQYFVNSEPVQPATKIESTELDEDFLKELEGIEL